MTNITVNELPEIIDARTLAEFFRIGYSKALGLIKYSGLDYIKIGNTYRITKKSFEKWLYEEGQRVIDVDY